MSEARAKAKELLDEMEALGLKSIDIYPGENMENMIEEDYAEKYYAELCRLLEGIKNGDGEKLVFKDSQKIGDENIPLRV